MRIITIDLTNKSLATIALTQYDYGVKLKLVGLTLQEGLELHIETKTGVAIAVPIELENEELIATLPDKIMQKCFSSFKCWVYDETDEQGATIKTIQVNLQSRERPSDIAPIEQWQDIKDVVEEVRAEKDRIDEAIKEAEDFKDRASVIVTDGTGDKYLADNGKYKVVQGGTNNYLELLNLPTYNGNEIKGDMSNTLASKEDIKFTTDETTTNNVQEFGDFIVREFGNALQPIYDGGLIPSRTSDLENDSHFATEQYVEQEIANFDFIKIVTELPTTGLPNRTYFVAKTDTKDNDLYDEYMWVNNAWEFVGTKTIDVDLTDYVKKNDFATSENAGVIRLGNGVQMNAYHQTQAINLSKQNYQNQSVNLFVSKGTLESLKTKSTDSFDNSDDISIPTTLAVSKELSNYTTKEYVDRAITDLKVDQGIRMYTHGNPTINMGIASGFSVNDYLEFPKVVSVDKPFELKFAIITGNELVSQQNIIDSNFGLALAIQNSKLIIALSSNGTSWNIGAIFGTYTLQPNTPYFIKINWDGTTYRAFISTDGSNYIEDITRASSLSLYPRPMFVGVGNLFFEAPRNHFEGSIDFNEAFLYLEDEEIWRGVGQNFASNDLLNITEKGVEVIRDAVKVKSIIDMTNHSTVENRLKLDVDITESGLYILQGTGWVGIPNHTESSKMLHIVGGETRLIFNNEADLVTIYGDSIYNIEFRNIATAYDWNKAKLVAKSDVNDIKIIEITENGEYELPALMPIVGTYQMEISEGVDAYYKLGDTTEQMSTGDSIKAFLVDSGIWIAKINTSAIVDAFILIAGEDVIIAESAVIIDDIVASDVTWSSLKIDDTKADKEKIETLRDTSVNLGRLVNNTIYRCFYNLTSLSFTLPVLDSSYNYIVELDIKTGETVPSINYGSSSIKWIGNPVENRLFKPEANKEYTIMINWNGSKWIGIVQEVDDNV